MWRKCITEGGLNCEQQEDKSCPWLSVILWVVVSALQLLNTEWRVCQTLIYIESEGQNVEDGLKRSWHLVHIYIDCSNSVCLMLVCGPFYFKLNPTTSHVFLLNEPWYVRITLSITYCRWCNIIALLTLHAVMLICVIILRGLYLPLFWHFFKFWLKVNIHTCHFVWVFFQERYVRAKICLSKLPVLPMRTMRVNQNNRVKEVIKLPRAEQICRVDTRDNTRDTFHITQSFDTLII